MDSHEARDRLLVVARDRLRNMPGAYRRFQFTIENTVQGVALTAAAQAMPYVYEVGEQMGNAGATERITEHLTRIVDRWAQSQPVPAGVEPLARPAPLPMTGAKVGAKQTGTRSPAAPTDAQSNRTWWDVAEPYITKTMKRGQFGTAKLLFNALFAEAGTGDSPFDKGSGQHRGSLFVREIAQPVALKTMQNKWSEIRSAAARK